MANAVPSGGGSTSAANHAVAPVSNVIDSRPFLLLLGQIIGVLILAWIAGISDRIGIVVVAFFAVLWLLFIMNRSDVIALWGARLGLPQPNQKVVVQ